jgi:ferrochelatase
VARIEKDNPERIILLPLYPHYSIATTGSSNNEWKKVISTNDKVKNIPSALVEKYQTNKLYIDSIIERVNQGLERFPAEKRKDVYVLFSAHGTPVKLVKQGDPYSLHIKETVDAVVKTMDMQQKNMLCFQSKVGPQKWLTPSTPDTVVDIISKGAKNILMIPVAFTSDHLETLFELNIEYRHLAKESGAEQYEVTEGLNDSETFVSALEQLVLDKAKEMSTE